MKFPKFATPHNPFAVLCHDALKRALGREFDFEVPFAIGAKSHKVDLATVERDVIVECKAYAWRENGGVPSAKITGLRDAVALLLSIQVETRVLILKRAVRAGKKESLAEYFVRLNADRLGPVIVLELPETGGDLVHVHGTL